MWCRSCARLQELDEATRDPENDPKLEVIAPPNGLRVWAVEDRLVQVLRNLIGNARSFSPPRGRIVARVRDAGGMAELCVEDEGPGIPDSNLEHIFDRFYSERPKGESFGQHSGLGPVDQPADHRGAARAGFGGKPPRRRRAGARGTVYRSAADCLGACL